MFTKLYGHSLISCPGGGVNVVAATTTLSLEDGASVELPMPFLPIGNDLAVCPAVAPSGATGVSIDLTRWSPARVSADCVSIIPFSLGSQSVAVRAARAFDADPDTDWADSPAQVRVWLDRWLKDGAA